MKRFIYKMRVNITFKVFQINTFQVLLQGRDLEINDMHQKFHQIKSQLSDQQNTIFHTFCSKLHPIEMILQAVNGRFLITNIRNHDTCYYSTSKLGPSVSRDVTL